MGKKEMLYYYAIGIMIICTIIFGKHIIDEININNSEIKKIDEYKVNIKTTEDKIKSKTTEKEKIEKINNDYKEKETLLMELKTSEVDLNDTKSEIATKKADIEQMENEIESSKKSKEKNHTVALTACSLSFSGIASCEIQDDVLIINPDDSAILIQAKLNTNDWQELVKTAKKTAKSMAEYELNGISMQNPANTDNTILRITGNGIVIYDLGRDG